MWLKKVLVLTMCSTPNLLIAQSDDLQIVEDVTFCFDRLQNGGSVFIFDAPHLPDSELSFWVVARTKSDRPTLQRENWLQSGGKIGSLKFEGISGEVPIARNGATFPAELFLAGFESEQFSILESQMQERGGFVGYGRIEGIVARSPYFETNVDGGAKEETVPTCP